jgi:alkylation response protein AidB-like acyl-CoA dehydrogenase
MNLVEWRSSWMDDELDALKSMTRQFLEQEAVPHHARWEQQQHVDRDFWRKAGDVGLLCPGIPEKYGGGGGGLRHEIVIFEETARALLTGWANQIHSGMVAHYILGLGREEQRQRWLPGMASGELVGAIGMTEPGAGTDLKRVTTRATRDGNHYVISGAKTFISNGWLADLVVVVASTNPAAGARGISLIVVETDRAEGFSRGAPLHKLGMHAQDTCELHFDNVRVPVENLLGGAEGKGFGQLMEHLVAERLIIAAQGIAAVERAIGETVAYTKQRQVFGAPLFELQNTRFKLAECHTAWRVARAFLDDCICRHDSGGLDAATAAMAKWWCTDQQFTIADACLQLYGGYGYMWEYPISRMFADARAQSLYGGSNEIMKELVARVL